METEKGLGGIHGLLELHHDNRNSGPQPPCSSHTESYFLLTSLSWPPLLAAWHSPPGGLQGLPCPAVGEGTL